MTENVTPQDNPEKDPKDWVTGEVSGRGAGNGNGTS
jgi:hypothetical protein